MRQGRVWRGARTAALLVPMVMTLVWAGAGAVSAATLTVCPSGCPYSQIGPAVAAAKNGDTIKVGPGTYQGGITIDVSVRLAGAGAGLTIIRGGDHVLTIGAFGAPSEPAVSVSGVTITGGVARSSPVSELVFGVKGLWAAGGGVEIPPQDIPAQGPAPVPGARVTISDSVITGNRADPSAAVPSGINCPGGFPAGQCPFAAAVGGGIESWGNLTLVHTTVSDNTVGPAAGLPAICSDCDGAGILSEQGSLTLTGTTVAGNRAIAAAPNGRFAEGGALYVGLDFGGTDALTVGNSTVTGNSASLTTNLPKFAGGQLIELNANSGGIHVGDGVPTTVDGTVIKDNSASADGPHGEADAIDAAMNVGDSPLTIRDSTISGNRLTDNLATNADSGSDGSAVEADGGGIISNTRITGNTVTVVSPNGVAGNAGAGLAALHSDNDARLLTVSDSVISGNTAIARTSTGSATITGVGILNGGLLKLDRVVVSRNDGTAIGPSGTAQGGGIWNSTDISGPPVQLTVDNTTVTNNSLTGSPGVTLQGGGLFTTLPVALHDSVISGNTPDQCFGCAAGAAHAAASRASRTPERGQEGLGAIWPGR
jgi:hypothetical protein